MSGGEVREQSRLGPLGERLLRIVLEDVDSYAAYERRRSERTERLQALEDELAAAMVALARPLAELFAAEATGGSLDVDAALRRVLDILALIKAELSAWADAAERSGFGRADRYLQMLDLAGQAIEGLEGEQGVGAMIAAICAKAAETERKVPRVDTANGARARYKHDRKMRAQKMDLEGSGFAEIKASVVELWNEQRGQMPPLITSISDKTLARYGVIERRR